MEATSIVSLVLIVLAATLVIKGVVIVSQSEAIVIERLGKFNRTLEGGFHIIIPIIDNPVLKVTKQEQTIDIPRQNVITGDNASITVDGIVFIQIQNAKAAAYGVVDFKRAIGNLSSTTLRAEIGKLTLDQSLSSRDTLNSSILTTLDEATGTWGIKTMRVEIKEISVPEEIESSMNLQMKAEREKRAIELTASANKQEVITKAEGDLRKAELEAQAIELTAEANKNAQIKYAEGQKESMEKINASMKENQQAAEFLLAKDKIAAFDALAKSTTKDKVLIPYTAMDALGSMVAMKDFVGIAEAAK